MSGSVVHHLVGFQSVHTVYETIGTVFRNDNVVICAEDRLALPVKTSVPEINQ